MERTEENLTEEKISFIELLKSVDCGIAIFQVQADKSVQIQYVSEGFCRLCKGEQEEIMEAFRKDVLFGVDEKERERIHETFLRVYETGMPQEITYLARLMDGSSRWCTLKMTIIYREDHTATLYGTYIDVTNAKKNEEKLIQNEAATEAACTFAGMWMWTHNLDTDQIHVYQKLRKDFGLPEYMENYPECVLSLDYILPQYISLYRDKVQQVKNGESQVEFTIQIHYPDYTVHWVRYRMNTMAGTGMMPRTAICTAQPIDTEMALEARIEIEQKKQQNAEQSLVAYIILNLNKNILLEHKAFRTGSPTITRQIPMQQAVDEAAADIATPEEKENFYQMHDRERLLEFYANGGTTDYIDFRRRLRNGNIVWVRNTLDLLCDPSTGDILVYEYCYDIHKKKMVEEIMSSAIDFDYEQFGSLDLLNDQITTIHSKNEHTVRDMTILKYSPDCARYADQFLSGEEKELFLQNVSVKCVLEQLKDKDVYEFVHRVVRQDGSVHVKKNRFACYDRDKMICLFTRTDVTDIVAAEEQKQRELAKALKMEQKATLAKSDFLSRMSHEIRTPMNAIIGMTKLAQEADSWDETREYLGKIYSSSDYLLGMLNDILDMSRIENGKFELNREWIPMESVLVACVDMIEPLMKQKQIHFIHPDAKQNLGLEFYVDMLRTRQILMNLLNNAYKFTPTGGTVSLEMKNISYDESHSVDRIIISDTGCGMSKEYMAKIFEPFEQERNPYSDVVQGTGLGLPLVKEIIAAVGGQIEVQSEIGKGTTFTIIFPYQYRIAQTEKAPERDTLTDGAKGLTGKRVLLVDDHPLNREIAHKLLKKKDIVVDEAENGRQAVDLYLAKNPDYYDAILMDIRMPVMDGLEATIEIRRVEAEQQESHQAIPIIAMTANAFHEDLEKSMALGMSAYLAKPINPKLLYSTLEEQMNQKR